MKKIAIIFMFCQMSYCQEVKEITPSVKYIIDLSRYSGVKFDEAGKLYENEVTDLSKNDKLLMAEYDRFVQSNSGYALGCSWYCGGEVSSITATSTLATSNNANYEARNIHDFCLSTAWIEGNQEYGIGEFVEYSFKANTPRVTTLYILNGYMKNYSLWKMNSRVKKLNLYLNDKLYAILKLRDNTGVQEFFIDTPFKDRDHPPYKLKFEIADVYRGSKYRDTAITEINLSGLDVHCVASGSIIRISEEKCKNVEDIVKGERIVTYDVAEGKFIGSQVNDIFKVCHKSVYRITTKSTELLVTEDHPILTKERTFITLNCADSGMLDSVEIGLYSSGSIIYERIVKIEKIVGYFETYNLEVEGKKDNCFIANNILVKSEK